MPLETFLLYLATVTIFFATPPGTSQILFVSNSLRFGLGRTLWTGFGDLTANSLQMAAAGFGLAAVIAASAEALTIIKWAGVAYLVYYGVRTFLAAPASLERTPGAVSSRRLWLQGFLTSLANPEAVFFFAALFPQFIDPGLPIAPQLLILGLTYLVFDGVILVLMGLGAEKLLGGLRRRARLMNRLAGTMMVAAAGLLGLKDVEVR